MTKSSGSVWREWCVALAAGFLVGSGQASGAKAGAWETFFDQQNTDAWAVYDYADGKYYYPYWSGTPAGDEYAYFTYAGDYAVTFLDRYGNEIGRRGILQIDTVPLEEFPDHLIKAVLATEDRRFFEHFGIDVIGTMRALTVNARSSGVVQGGSSITQQLAKNLFLSNERTITRKINEAFLALWLEHHLTKRDIL